MHKTAQSSELIAYESVRLQSSEIIAIESADTSEVYITEGPEWIGVIQSLGMVPQILSSPAADVSEALLAH